MHNSLTDATSILAECFYTIFLTISSPNLLRSLAFFVVKNRSKIRGKISGEIPLPLSVTAKSRMWFLSITPTVKTLQLSIA